MSGQIIVFTDLDETLLEYRTYSFAPAEPALSLLREKDIPLIIVSSKTAIEIEHYRRLLNNNHPFSSENGGGVFLPEGYFSETLGYKPEGHGEYSVITLGTPYQRLRKAVQELRASGFEGIRGFGDMSAAEVSAITGLSSQEAELSLKRHFDEPFIYEGADLQGLQEAIRGMGLSLKQGRLMHITGNNDKGTSVDILKDLYQAKYGEITTVALGDSPTDISMLMSVDYPVAVMKNDGSYDARLDMPGLMRARGSGPDGFNSALLELIPDLTEN